MEKIHQSADESLKKNVFQKDASLGNRDLQLRNESVVKSVFYAVAVSLLGSAVVDPHTSISKWLLAGAYFVFYSLYFYDEQKYVALKRRVGLEFLSWCMFFIAAVSVQHVGWSMIFFLCGLILAEFTFDRHEHRDWHFQNLILIATCLSGDILFWLTLGWCSPWRRYIFPIIGECVFVFVFVWKVLIWRKRDREADK